MIYCSQRCVWNCPRPDRHQAENGGVNPWDVEHGPNPIIFPHLISPDSHPVQIYSPPILGSPEPEYLTSLPRPRRRGASRARGNCGFIHNQPQLNLNQAAEEDIHPRSVECGPNPGIVPHLTEPSAPNSSGDSLEYFEVDPALDNKVSECSKTPSRSATPSDILFRTKRSQQDVATASPEVDLEFTEFSRLEDTVNINSPTVAEESSRTWSPATTKSTLSWMDKGQGPARDMQICPEAVEPTNFVATIPEQSHEELTMNIDSVPPVAVMPIVSLPEPHGGPSHSTELRCSKCNQAFRLPGLLRQVDAVTIIGRFYVDKY